MIVMGVIARLLLPGLFESNVGRMSNLLSQYNIGESGGLAGGRRMMHGSPLFSNLFAIFNQIILEALLYAFLPAMVIALIFSAVMSRQFVQTLIKMTAAADRIADGHYKERIPFGGTAPEQRDELQRLGSSFNNMALRLEQMEETRKQMISDVAHELRTPLTVIKGSLEGLMDGVLETAPKTLESVYRQTERLDRLVNDLHELNYLEDDILEFNPKPVNLNHFLMEIYQSLQVNFQQKSVDLCFDLPDEEILIRVDEDRLQQVLMNLFSNALRYTPKGGEVRLSVCRDDGMALVKVADTGIGIPEEHLPHIFERLYRVSDSRSRMDGGSGLGLTIAKMLVEQHGGTIWAESPGEGQGTIILFTLPLIDQ
jgi:histidine kinase